MSTNGGFILDLHAEADPMDVARTPQSTLPSGRAVRRRERSCLVGSLEMLRARLDGIDEELLDRLRQRIECCVDIAHYKREHGVPMMQPDRVRLVHDRAARYGERHGIAPTFLRQLYQLIVDETCRVEDAVIASGAAPAGAPCDGAAGG